MDDKKVLIPLEEYENLLKDNEAYSKIADELKKDCKDRGLYIEVTVDLYGYDSYHEKLGLDPRVKIISKDAALEAAAGEIERLSKLLRAEKRYSKNMEDKVRLMSTRNVWQRLTGKYVEE